MLSSRRWQAGRLGVTPCSGRSPVCYRPARRRPEVQRWSPCLVDPVGLGRRAAPLLAANEASTQTDGPTKIGFKEISEALHKAYGAWDSYATNKTGTLNIDEAVRLLNSAELSDAAFFLTGVRPLTRTADSIRESYKKADADKSGDLNRSEFLAMWLALILERVKANPLVLAEALLGVLDIDKNGKIDGKELKVLLTILRVPGAMFLPIPASAGIEYRKVLQWASGEGKGQQQ